MSGKASLKEFATTVGSFMRAFSKKMEKIEAGSGTLVGPMDRSLSRHRSLSSICLPLCCALELAFHPLHVFPSIAARPPLCPSSYLYSANQQPHIPRPAAHSHTHTTVGPLRCGCTMPTATARSASGHGGSGGAAASTARSRGPGTSRSTNPFGKGVPAIKEVDSDEEAGHADAGG